MKDLFDNLESFYSQYSNPKYVIDGWAIVDNSFYESYKNKVKLISIKINSTAIPVKDIDEVYVNNIQNTAYCETMDKYVKLRYNSNFIAVNIYEREYEYNKGIKLVSIRKMSDFNLLDKPPEFKLILNILGWKASKKVLDNIETF
jgi:hypothetical protein